MRVFAYGTLQTVPNRTWERVLRQFGGQRAKTARGADLIVIGAGAASRPTAAIGDDLSRFRDSRQAVQSERVFLRSIGLLPALPAEPRSFSAADLAARAKLPGAQIKLLALFDVIEPDPQGLFGFRDMKAAIQAARILQTASFSDLVFACGQVRERLGVASPLSELTLQSDSAGRISLGAGDRTADLSGQFRLDLEDNPPTVSVLLADAEDARETGESGQAVQLLRRVLAASPKNLDALFELGSLLCEEDQFSEGIALLRKAAALRPGFADAWYNIGHALERQGRRAEAREAYARAVTADPTYPDPLYNLGMIELDDARYREAVDWLQAYLALDGDSEWATKARKALALARMSLVKAAG